MADAQDPRIGTTLLGKLRVDGLLGEGGMGAVYRVHHEVTKHDRALKVLHAQFADDAVIFQRLLREAGVAGTLRTDHVVETFDVGKLDDGSPYVLMELMDGVTLAERMAAARLPVSTLVGFVCQAAEGIVHAHAAGIIHRDLKPDNLFLVTEGGSERIKLLDFGISKFHIDPIKGGGAVTQEGTVMGTPLYMSPEQAAGKTVGPQSDIYSLGVILYEGLTGQTPHEAESYPAFLLKLHTVRPTPVEELVPGVDPKLAAVVDKALATLPEDRYPSAQAFLRVLLPFAEGSHTAHMKTLSGLPSVKPDLTPPKSLPVERPTGIEDTVVADEEMTSTTPATPSQLAAHAAPDSPEPVSPVPPSKWPWAVAAVALLLAGAALVAFMRGPEVNIEAERAMRSEGTPNTPTEAAEDAGPEPPLALDPPPLEPDPAPVEPDPTPAQTDRPRGRRGPRPTESPRQDPDRFEIERDNPY
ncbi:MAG: serine/threonine-protein kinase [Sandaracinaceae bacterium]